MEADGLTYKMSNSRVSMYHCEITQDHGKSVDRVTRTVTIFQYSSDWDLTNGSQLPNLQRECESREAFVATISDIDSTVVTCGLLQILK